jgi:hypothetical protein
MAYTVAHGEEIINGALNVVQRLLCSKITELLRARVRIST